MTQPELLAAEVRAYCAANADAKLAQRYARYFKEGYDAWGFLDKNHPIWNEKEPEWREKYAVMKLRGFLRLGDILFTSGKYEEGALAIRFIKGFLDELDEPAVQRLGKWFEAGIANWAHVDVLCGEVIAPLLQKGQIGLATISGWRESKLKYQRRAVPVAMLGLLKAGKKRRSSAEIPSPADDGPRTGGSSGGWLVPPRGLEEAARACRVVPAGVEGQGSPPDLPIRHRKDVARGPRAISAWKRPKVR